MLFRILSISDQSSSAAYQESSGALEVRPDIVMGIGICFFVHGPNCIPQVLVELDLLDLKLGPWSRLIDHQKLP